jgi:DNA-binding transcriptional regulator YdaS (Cro superfamily)
MTLANYMSATGKTDAQLAAALGVNAEVVRLWRHGRRRIAAERVIELSNITGIPRHELRPDLWEPPISAPPQVANETRKAAARKRSAAIPAALPPPHREAAA